MDDMIKYDCKLEETIRKDFEEMKSVLDLFTRDEENFRKIQLAAELMIDSLKSGHKIYSCGNGGSMSDATHFCEELLARYRDNRKALPAIAISDSSFITCVGNDYGFDKIFSRFIEACGNEGDVLLGISTSGNSEDVVEAAAAAMDKGMKVIVLTGKPNGNLIKHCDIELCAPPTKYSDRAQEIHIKIIHCLVHLIEQGMGLSEI